jgi:hypothetical protein
MFTSDSSSRNVASIQQPGLTPEQIAAYKELFPDAVVKHDFALVEANVNRMHFDANEVVDGEPIKPRIMIKDPAVENGAAFAADEDNFTIDYGEPADEPGEYTVTVAPKEGGLYFGEAKTITWYIDEPKDDHFSLTVDGGTVVDPTNHTLVDGERITVQATKKDGCGWYDVTSNNPVLLSKEETYSFFIHSDITLRYQPLEDDDVAKDGTAKVYFGELIGEEDPTAAYVTIPVYVSWELPDNAVITNAGTYRKFTEAGSAAPDSITMKNSGVFKKTTSGLKTKKAYTYNININKNSQSISKDLYLEVWVEYSLDDGETTSLFSDVVKLDAIVVQE